MSSSGLRVVVAGATGALGRELLAVMEERRFPLSELRPFATDRSTGEEIEFLGDLLSVESGPPPLRGMDLLILCTPAAAAPDLVRDALRAEVACIDCSGALTSSPEVPVIVHDLCGPRGGLGQPLITTPAGPGIGWALVLSALARRAGLERVVGTLLQSAAGAGRAGIEALSGETVALLGQREAPASDVFPAPVAFDCVPTPAAAREGDHAIGQSECEARIALDLARVLASDENGAAPAIAVTAVHVPTFVGDGSALAVETTRALSATEASQVLAKAPGVELRDRDDVGPSTRDSAGCDRVLVGRVRSDPSCERGLLLWLAADSQRMSAVNAVKIAESRLRLH